ncbi:MAG: methylmalonyl Co-A mutase-associated GTPase MeaB [Phycisphaerales bacterium]|nr:methylmalonyl Co-A mutase-associated GTPase MeaB [Phycisphaerales bacterium]
MSGDDRHRARGVPRQAAGPGFGLSVARAPESAGAGGPDPTPDASARPAPAVLSLDEYARGVESGDRAVLGRAISLVESNRPEHRAMADRLVDRLLPRTGGAVRVGITGVPGAGKSTFIERMGTMLTASGLRVAVLAVDPSSEVTGGSILGDKTRMPRLSADARAFIRPSPTGGALGGVARHTREALLLCEAAGFDVVLVETVGVGQSETVVADMTDFFIAVMIAGAGDELQGIKRGLLELVDLIAVNKADGDNTARAAAAAREYAAVLRLVGRRDGGAEPVVLACSALTGAGVGEVWEAARSRVEGMRASGRLAERRREQELRWMHALAGERLRRLAFGSPEVAEATAKAEEDVRAGRLRPGEAAGKIVRAVLARMRAAKEDGP